MHGTAGEKKPLKSSWEGAAVLRRTTNGPDRSGGGTQFTSPHMSTWIS